MPDGKAITKKIKMENTVETLQEKTGKLRLKSINEDESLDEAKGRYKSPNWEKDEYFLNPDGTYRVRLGVQTNMPRVKVTFESEIYSDKKNASKDAEMMFIYLIKHMARAVRGTSYENEIDVKKISNKTGFE